MLHRNALATKGGELELSCLLPDKSLFNGKSYSCNFYPVCSLKNVTPLNSVNYYIFCSGICRMVGGQILCQNWKWCKSSNANISKGRQTSSHEHVFRMEYSMTHLLALLGIITGWTGHSETEKRRVLVMNMSWLRCSCVRQAKPSLLCKLPNG